MPSALEELLSDNEREGEGTTLNRDISARIGVLRARLMRAGNTSGDAPASDQNSIYGAGMAPNTQVSPGQSRQTSMPKALRHRNSIDEISSSVASPQIPRSSLSEAQYQEELFSSRLHDRPASSSLLEVEMLRQRVKELENEVLVLKNENEILRNRMTIACSQNLCRSTVHQHSTGPSSHTAGISKAQVAKSQQGASVSNIKPVSLDMSDFERQWQAIEAGVTNCVERTSVSEPHHNNVYTPKTGASSILASTTTNADFTATQYGLTQVQTPAHAHAQSSLMSASRIAATPSVWCNDAYKKSRRLNKEIEEALGNAMVSSINGLSMTGRRTSTCSIVEKAIPNQYTSVSKVALPTAGNFKEAMAPRLIGIDEGAEEPCIVWRRETTSGLIPSGALALEHVNECIYGEHAQVFRGWVIKVRKEGEQRSISDIINDWRSLSPEQLVGVPKAGSPSSIVLLSRTRALCFEIHNPDDYDTWVNFLLEKFN